MPCGVGGDLGVGVGRDEPEERGGDQPRAGYAVGVAEHRDLFDVGHLTDVDLLRELAAYRSLDVLVVPEPAAGECPSPLVRRACPLPCEHLQRALADLQHRRQHLVLSGAGHARMVSAAGAVTERDT
jgi:hypothetical protein